MEFFFAVVLFVSIVIIAMGVSKLSHDLTDGFNQHIRAAESVDARLAAIEKAVRDKNTS